MIDLRNSINWEKFSVTIILGYIVSWVYFFITNSFFETIFGKVKGSIVNYSISWMIWIITVYILNKIYPNGNKNNILLNYINL